ncbi:MAG: bifunctional diguanylate cyclase/phosphodiesterase [Acaryochloris sp. RU_4_1]|nr:bifunctional diguanylate cyclase/phosphodiesterase [Acaryochloris sp. SU_5_25]NJM65536.1 bifunctional diguanylate cyclase/phosphodiesterase [Acaryochloris sp. RU_4_1]NJR54384.1 bifunctional diguanylate cyclase/phosphodiesterase [Acaryochloris sp. CRU_2_0]
MTESLSADVLAALGILVLESTATDSLTIVGTIPKWFTQLYPTVTHCLDCNWIELHSPFLANFLIDAAEFWAKDEFDCIKSGLWYEQDQADQTLYLEASALKVGSQQIVLVKASVLEDLELCSLIQTARETTLDVIEERKQTSQHILKATFYDPLTGLPNQSYFLIQLAQAFERYKQQAGYHFAILVINIDRFQSINDSFGRLAGDQLLISIAWRLKNCLGELDLFARLGGDEFIILLDPIDTISSALLTAQQISTALKYPFSLNAQELFMTASVGIAFTLMNYDRAEDLLRDANTAVNYGKSLGRDNSIVFDPAMHARSVRLLQLENDLKRALQEQELNLFYQPIVCLADQRIIGFEALVRWVHPRFGLVPPLEFIPIAEETGLIIAIDQWILKEACCRIQQWRQFTEEPLSINVNFSAQQFDNTNLVLQVRQVLQEAGIAPHHLMIEITESVLFSQDKAAVEMLHQLKALGVRLCIDDFGTGYASLQYLQQLPVDTLKIDRSFIKRMDADNLDLVRSIITLAHDLGMTVTAEGVETPVQRRFLLDLGCQEAQGHLFSHPVDGQMALQLLQSVSIQDS